MTRLFRAARRATAAIAVVPVVVLAQRTPASGTDVLQMMRQKYVKSWYPTLTFSQKTTITRGGTTSVETWYESLAYAPGSGTRLRIDMGDLSKGNGVIYTADSVWVMRADTLVRAVASGNPFLPLIEGVYLQPVAETVRQLQPYGIDLGKVTRGTWAGRPAWIVGATTASDSTSPQFWIDTDRLVLVRMILRLAPNRPPDDIHLDGLVRTGGGWLATRVTMLANGVPQQTEEYAGWKTGMSLDPGLFAPATWGTAKHWAKP